MMHFAINLLPLTSHFLQMPLATGIVELCGGITCCNGGGHMSKLLAVKELIKIVLVCAVWGNGWQYLQVQPYVITWWCAGFH